MLQGDAYTGNWLSSIRHTPKLARRMDVSTMSLVAELYPDKTHVLYVPRHAVIHCKTLPHCYTFQLMYVQSLQSCLSCASLQGLPI